MVLFLCFVYSDEGMLRAITAKSKCSARSEFIGLYFARIYPFSCQSLSFNILASICSISVTISSFKYASPRACSNTSFSLASSSFSSFLLLYISLYFRFYSSNCCCPSSSGSSSSEKSNNSFYCSYSSSSNSADSYTS